MADDLVTECKTMDAVIKKNGGIDLMLVGIGMNGHIGFNEPGTPFTILSHVATLDEVTRSVGQKYFTEKTSLNKGITIGPGHLMNARKVILMANGIKKAGVIKSAVEGPVTPSFPASVMQQHKNSIVLVDDEAAALLDKSKTNR
jgi:6-phosphogluconolactonase/glucosamine-6-phosphate isomerase/deaminase